MRNQLLIPILVLVMTILPETNCFARGFGGGGFRGGGGGFRGGLGGGGFRGGGGLGGGGRLGGGGGFRGDLGGNLGGGGRLQGLGGGGGFRGDAGGNLGGGGRLQGLGGGGNLGGGGLRGDGGNLGGGGRLQGLGGGNFDRGNLGGGGLRGDGSGLRGDGSGLGGGNLANKFSDPSRGQLNNFLGLPSDSGLNTRGSGKLNNLNRNDLNRNDLNRNNINGNNINRNDINRNNINGNNINRNDINRNNINNNNFNRNNINRNNFNNNNFNRNNINRNNFNNNTFNRTNINVNRTYATGFRAVSPSVRYNTAVAVRGNFHSFYIYSPTWRIDHPGAWFAAGWTAGYVWRAATWPAAYAWCGCYNPAPYYYDYGNNITYQNNTVYVSGQNSESSTQYYNQAASLAGEGAQEPAQSDSNDSSDGSNWLPLGVFALTQDKQDSSNITIQLAVNKQGVIRGNYTNVQSGKSQVIQGAVNKKNQKVAFTVGDDKSTIYETGLYNLTKDEAPALVHEGKDKTEQELLVRLKKPDGDSSDDQSSGDSGPTIQPGATNQ